MMTLYSGITCPFSQRCRFVLYEKGMDFEIKMWTCSINLKTWL